LDLIQFLSLVSKLRTLFAHLFVEIFIYFASYLVIDTVIGVKFIALASLFMYFMSGFIPVSLFIGLPKAVLFMIMEATATFYFYLFRSN